MADAAREIKTAADDIQNLARRIRKSPHDTSVELWAKRIIRLTDDIEDLVRKLT